MLTRLTPFFCQRKINHLISTCRQMSKVNISVTDDGKTIVCWHPEPSFPYEFSRPVPALEDDLREGDSVLKIQFRNQAENMFTYKRAAPYNHELQQCEQLQMLTHTPVYDWRTKWRVRKDRIKDTIEILEYPEGIPKDREGI